LSQQGLEITQIFILQEITLTTLDVYSEEKRMLSNQIISIFQLDITEELPQLSKVELQLEDQKDNVWPSLMTLPQHGERVYFLT
jgi:hypothetical protein